MTHKSSPTSSKSNINTDNLPLFKPRRGGDVMLKSRDGVKFCAHAAISKLASQVFDAMLPSDSTEGVIQFAEDAQTLSTVLQFVYPTKIPTMLDHDMLASCLMTIHKYNIYGTLENLDQQISLNPPPCLLTSDPVRIYTLALKYKLHATKRAAASLITSACLDFCDFIALPQLAQTYPSSELLRLTNIQAMRFKILSEVLFAFDKPPMLPRYKRPRQFAARNRNPPPAPDPTKLSPWHFVCYDCLPDKINQLLEKFKYIPCTWTLAWAQLVHKTLPETPLEQSGFLFDMDLFSRFRGELNVCQLCIGLFTSASQDPEFEARKWFDCWAGEVKKALEEKWAGLENVYAI